ncbi:hypothetical protein F5883DRAFT_441241 [Diaporthe sp. PMI_573]|nr:hypothetical protein F5883DRAFT_441241 [Diaporthaceae sp. PMI_573]
MCCFGHILNLIAKAFLLGFEADGSNKISWRSREDRGDDYRKNSSVVKLHNIIKYIRALP